MTKFLEMDIQRFASGLDFPTTFTIHCYGETSRGIFEEFDTDTETKDFLNLGSQYTWSPKLKDGYVFDSENPNNILTVTIPSSYVDSLHLYVYYKAINSEWGLRNIKVGDNLNNKKIYFNISTQESDDALFNLVNFPGQMIFTTNMNYCFSEGNNSYSLGTRYYAGLYDNLYDEESGYYLWSPNIELFAFSTYSGGSYGWDNGPLFFITCPVGTGIVSTIETSKEIYSRLFIDTQEANEFTAYYGEHKIQDIKFNNTSLYRVMLGDIKCYDELKTFKIKTKTFFKDRGNWTWKQWIDQGKYFTEADGFSYGETSDGYSYLFYDTNGSLYYTDKEGVYHDVSYTDLIIDDQIYSVGRACLSAETLIKTLNGNIQISLLNINDKLDNNNTVEKIVKHNRNYYYEVILSNDETIKASNDHRFILANNEIKMTEQLQINDYLTDNLYVKDIKQINKSLDMYEIKTSTNKYELYNGIICECENI